MDYYSRPEVSNSDLTELKKMLFPREDERDPTDAYYFGNLLDAIITEPQRVDTLNFTLDGVRVDMNLWDKAWQMRRAFFKDPLCIQMLKQSSTQQVMNKVKTFEWGNLKYELPVRCKWDMWQNAVNWGGDLKSTAATTQQQFIEACHYFDYDRQRAWYMDIAGSNQDILIGISKVNFKVFKLPIRRGDSFFNSGKEKYEYLAFEYYKLFS